MVSRIMPYVDRATNSVPNFGKGNALLFTAGLLAETLRRFTMTEDTDHNRINIYILQMFKIAQSLPISFGGSGSHITKYVAGPVLSFGLQFTLIHQLIATFTRVASFKGYDTSYYCQIEVDRPDFVFFVQVAGEVVNIASKIIGSLTTGLVVQQMVTRRSTGKIRIVVSAALLALSAYNVCAHRQELKIHNVSEDLHD